MARDRLTSQQRRQIRKLVRTHDPLIRAAFIEAVDNAKGQIDFDALVRAVQLSDYAQAFELLRLNQLVLFPLDDAIRAAIIASGQSLVLPRGVRGAFSFSGRHPRAEAIIARVGADLVTEIGNPGADAIRDIMLTGRQRGRGVQEVAESLAGKLDRRSGKRKGGIMGLDGPRADRAARVREILSDPNQIAGYFRGDKPRYSRTDPRFDALVRKAIDKGRALSPSDVDRISQRHVGRLLKDRSETISEHEAFRAQAQGRREAYAQLLESGHVESIDKRWDHNTLENARLDHQALDGKRVDFNEPFVMADGTRMQMPHDPDAPAHHTIGCRCSMVYIPQYRRPSQ